MTTLAEIKARRDEALASGDYDQKLRVLALHGWPDINWLIAECERLSAALAFATQERNAHEQACEVACTQRDKLRAELAHAELIRKRTLDDNHELRAEYDRVITELGSIVTDLLLDANTRLLELERMRAELAAERTAHREVVIDLGREQEKVAALLASLPPPAFREMEGMRVPLDPAYSAWYKENILHEVR